MTYKSTNKLNETIQSTDEFLGKLDSLSLAEHFSFASDRISVYVKTLYEGYNGFSDKLINGDFDLLVDKKIKFLNKKS